MIRTQRVSVAGARVALYDGADGEHPGGTVVVRNSDGTNPVAVGGPDVTEGNGLRLQPGQTLVVPLQRGDTLHAVTPGNTATATVTVVVDVLVAGA